ncbi:4-alpha-glucanotransferase [Kushneria phosphatilytica]|uniref:4-alpha-glucanotransferase n=1 Tax=Kushneria phosphatilytica TaxID=657387 RepID=A0A1S1NQ76_9GAMM|nr:4-alpha-glucanotransferase [Kushneria phosphatilytica]OHV10574.1 4-alpha-glucanotransferase [Kushneria phosphatilytica]QEL11850.1 4-alpha-glucanotransferase [Kushneria phosphatilytica]
MSEVTSSLHRLAQAAGIAIDWVDNSDTPHRVSDPVLSSLLAGLGLPADDAQQVAESQRHLDQLHHPEEPGQWPPLLTAQASQPVALPSSLPAGSRWRLTDESGGVREGDIEGTGALLAPEQPGYYQMEVMQADGATDQQSDLAVVYHGTLAVAPERAFTLDDIDVASLPRERRYGLTVPVYGLRRQGDGGLGDTAALEQLVRNAAAAGVDSVAISPVHALFAHDAERISPYAPSSRLVYNALHAAPDQLMGEALTREAFELDRVRLEALELIDYPAVAAARWRWLRRVFERFSHARGAAEDHGLKADFARFRRSRGRILEEHCCFEALCAAFGDPGSWPEGYDHIERPLVQEFMRRQREDVAFHAFTQWLIDRGLARAQRTAVDAGMAIGVIADIAVGVSPQGSQAWSRPEETLTTLDVGAPPDDFNPNGQNWGVAGFSPQGLVREGFTTFIETLRAGFRHAGGVRLDHIMGLSRLWLIPQGDAPTEGAYVSYPEEALLRLVALESWRHRAIVIGEDLGTVDPDFRQRLDERSIYGMRVLWFEREETGAFSSPASYTRDAVAMTSTHDLPTVAGWWQSRDIDWRERLALIDDPEAERVQRDEEREHLAEALGIEPTAPTASVVDGAIRLIARTASRLALIPIEDLMGEVEQANLPGTVDGHPNWCRRQPPEATTLSCAAAQTRLEILRHARAPCMDSATLERAYHITDPDNGPEQSS